MTSYRLFPSTSGPATAAANSGPFINAVSFAVSGGGKWFEGYWWWVCAGGGQLTTPVKCALWSVASATSGQVVPGSVVTSGTLTAGAWNWIPLPAPIQLAPTLNTANTAAGSMYIAAIGVNGPTPLTSSQFGTGQVYANGITNGPLYAFSDHPAAATGAPYMNQGLFTTSGSDPAVTMPNSGSNNDNFWVDVQVSDTDPAGYTITAIVGTTTYNLTVTDAVNGKVQWAVPASDTSKPGTYPYQIRVTDSAGEVFTAVYGNLVIRP